MDELSEIETAMDELRRHYVPVAERERMMGLADIIAFLESCGVFETDMVLLRDALRTAGYRETVVDGVLVFAMGEV